MKSMRILEHLRAKNNRVCVYLVAAFYSISLLVNILESLYYFKTFTSEIGFVHFHHI